jgi:phosphoribosylamine--glycine ligase
MKVAVLGNGAREHALVWKFSKSKRLTGLYAIPGNAGTAELAENVAINPEDGAAVVAFAREKGLDFVFIGPEQPLAAGVADELRAAGILTFGPGKKPATSPSGRAFPARRAPPLAPARRRPLPPT